MLTFGIDISHHKGEVPWTVYQSAGVEFVILKVTEGLNFTDPLAAYNINQARLTGIPWSGFHFYREVDWVKQIDLYQTRAAHVMPLFPAIDFEIWASDRLRVIHDLARIGSALQTIYRSPVLFYSSANYMSQFARYDLAPLSFMIPWVADWTGHIPRQMPPWVGWKIHQTTNRGVMPGIKGAFDLDTLNGPLADITRKEVLPF